MNHRGTQKLETERLILRRLTEADGNRQIIRVYY